MSAITSPSHNFPDFTELAEKLQATAQALLAISPPPEEESQKQPEPLQEAALQEVRHYSIPGFIVKEEKEMLELLKAEDWQDMFDKTYEQLYMMAMLMQHFEADEIIDGFSIQRLGNAFMVPLDTLRRLCSLVADFRPVSEDDLEAEME
ncbi:MAG: hypothetical protein FWG04_05610 [Desulfovibrionaceae bacterium]|nr:hypothetical protein [Desulfovibrionaceae bacterium]